MDPESNTRYETMSDKDIVDFVILDMIDEDENNIYRFEIYCSFNNDTNDKVGYFSSSTIYKNELNKVPCLNNEQNSLLMENNGIIQLFGRALSF